MMQPYERMYLRSAGAKVTPIFNADDFRLLLFEIVLLIDLIQNLDRVRRSIIIFNQLLDTVPSHKAIICRNDEMLISTKGGQVHRVHLD